MGFHVKKDVLNTTIETIANAPFHFTTTFTTTTISITITTTDYKQLKTILGLGTTKEWYNLSNMIFEYTLHPHLNILLYEYDLYCGATASYNSGALGYEHNLICDRSPGGEARGGELLEFEVLAAQHLRVLGLAAVSGPPLRKLCSTAILTYAATAAVIAATSSR